MKFCIGGGFGQPTGLPFPGQRLLSRDGRLLLSGSTSGQPTILPQFCYFFFKSFFLAKTLGERYIYICIYRSMQECNIQLWISFSFARYLRVGEVSAYCWLKHQVSSSLHSGFACHAIQNPDEESEVAMLQWLSCPYPRAFVSGSAWTIRKLKHIAGLRGGWFNPEQNHTKPRSQLIILSLGYSPHKNFRMGIWMHTSNNNVGTIMLLL